MPWCWCVTLSSSEEKMNGKDQTCSAKPFDPPTVLERARVCVCEREGPSVFQHCIIPEGISLKWLVLADPPFRGKPFFALMTVSRLKLFILGSPTHSASSSSSPLYSHPLPLRPPPARLLFGSFVWTLESCFCPFPLGVEVELSCGRSSQVGVLMLRLDSLFIGIFNGGKRCFGF